MRDWVTPEEAARHEALVTKLLRLLRQVEGIFARRPEEPVSEGVRGIAADLLFESEAFLSRRVGVLPEPAPDYFGLAAQLGQALAGLETFEARHTAWDAAQKAFAWRFPAGAARPVDRLRQAVARPAPPRHGGDVRTRLAKLLEARFAHEFDRGFAEGRAAALSAPEEEAGG